MIEPYVRPEFEEFSGSVTMRLVYDAIGEALHEIDQQLETVGPEAFEIALASRGYVKERTCMMVLETRRLSANDEFAWHKVVCSECGGEFPADQLSILGTGSGREEFSFAEYGDEFVESDYHGPYHGSDYRYCPHCGAKLVAQ